MRGPRVIRSVGIVVPAHDEEELLPDCLAALHATVAQAGAQKPGLRVRIVVVADACSDGTAALARDAGVTVVVLGARNVGRARAAGLRKILRHVPRNELATGLWLATTDADSRVPPDWLTRQLRYAAAGWEAVAGTVSVTDWTGHSRGTAAEFARQYGGWPGPHPHVHGANLGFTASAYLDVGGFRPLRTGEDRALVAAMQARGRRVLRASSLPVVTSARRRYRAPSGFGYDLTTLGGTGSLLGAQ
jgi:cellulose synthase/poly-beta-1,6-N-acetylglucosamine synthase-like glycosyltransferase